MNVAAVIACVSLLGLAYTYAGYPVLLALLARTLTRRAAADDSSMAELPAITVVIPAFNEAGRIAARVRDILAQDYPADRLKVIVVDDGSRDDTAGAAAAADPRCRVIRMPANGGKALALNAAMREVDTPVTVFGDARQRFAPGALRALVRPLRDPAVRSVSGRLLIEADDGAASEGIGVYWAIETRIRRDESRLGWLHGVSGAIHALRTDAYVPMQAGTLLDDMWMPLQVLFAGGQVRIAEDAIAIDRASADHREEYARKVRTLAGNWQLIARLPRLLSPLHNPVFFAWVSHKLLRLLAPWIMLAALLSCALAGAQPWTALFWLQCVAYLVAAGAIALPGIFRKIPMAGSAATFLMLNGAALMSLPAALTRNPGKLWKAH